VEFDESMITHIDGEQCWIIGAFEIDPPRKCKILFPPSSLRGRRQDITQFLWNKIEPGSICHSDALSSYYNEGDFEQICCQLYKVNIGKFYT